MRMQHPECEQDHDVPTVPAAAVVYGDVIYWGTIAASILTLLGQVRSFVSRSNYLSPTHVLSSIWEGKSVEEIWAEGSVVLPEGHWYLSQLAAGDGLTTAGLALGVFSVIPAIVGSAAVLLRQRERLFGSLAMIAGVGTTLALLGWL